MYRVLLRGTGLVAERVGPAGWTTLPELVQRCAEIRPDVPLLIDGERQWDGAALGHRVRAAAGLLAGAGVRAGDRVAVDTRGAHWSDVALTYCALSWLGAASVLVSSEQTAALAAEQVGVRLTVSAAGALSFDELIGHPAPYDGPPAAGPDDALDVVFTSGTTGTPKPVLSRHRDWTAASRPEMLASRGRRAVGHTGVPISTSGGLHGVFLNHLARGVTSIAASTPAELAAACARHPVRELHLTPYAARTLVHLMEPSPAWAEGVRIVRMVGAPLPDDVRAGLNRCLPRARLASIYALTEGGAAAFVNLGDGAVPSIGAPAPGSAVRIVDADGNPVPDGEPGEIVVRSASAPRYLLDGELNAELFRDGWTRTGDMGVRRPDGSVQLVGRAREQIILGSGRLAPETVEAMLRRRLPAQAEFVVAAVETSGRSDAIAVFLVGTAADPATREIRERLLAMKGPFRPGFVRCVDAIPRNAMGKPLRRELVKALLQSREQGD